MAVEVVPLFNLFCSLKDLNETATEDVVDLKEPNLLVWDGEFRRQKSTTGLITGSDGSGNGKISFGSEDSDVGTWADNISNEGSFTTLVPFSFSVFGGVSNAGGCISSDNGVEVESVIGKSCGEGVPKTRTRTLKSCISILFELLFTALSSCWLFKL